MDVQHKTIIELINKLYNEIRNGESGGAVLGILDEMIKYAEKHLQEEEDLLEKINYPDTEGHVAMHQMRRDRLHTLFQDVKKGNETAAMDNAHKPSMNSPPYTSHQ